MLKVLLATPVPPPEHGGIINWTRVVRRELGARPDLEMSFVDTNARYRGIPGLPLLSRLLFGAAQALRDTYRTYRKLKTVRPDVLHLNTSAGLATPKDLLILRIARWLGVPVVAHYHMQKAPKDILDHRFEWALMQWGMSQAAAVVTLDTESEACVRERLPSKLVVTLPTMIEIDVIDAIRHEVPAPTAQSPDGVKIIFLGFVGAYKGVRDLVEACVRLPEGPLVLDLVGPVERRFQDEIQLLAANRGNGDWLRFHGSVSHEEAIRRIMVADLLVLASHGESAPAVILEAMGCGKPVIGTTVGAIPESLDIGGPQECGICVPPRDVPALAAALAELLCSPEKRRALGEKGRKRAETIYALPVGCAKLLDLWRSVAQMSGRRRGKEMT
jgi:glycosyltransferase involved in cell wall biosynthesis